MGEATLFCKIVFETDEEAKEALPKIKEFWIEGIRAEEFWRKNRGMEREGRRESF